MIDRRLFDWGRVLAVARRDFVTTVRTPAFLVAVIGVPLFLALVGVGGFYLLRDRERPALTGTIALVGAPPDLAPALQRQLDPARLQDERAHLLRRARQEGGELLSGAVQAAAPTGAVQVEVVTADGPLDEALRARVRSGEWLAVVEAPPAVFDPAASASFGLLVGADLDADHVTLLERRVAGAIADVRLDRAGIEPDRARQLIDAPSARTRRFLENGRISDEGAARRSLRRTVVPLVFMMLLWAGAFVAGERLLFSTIEEKSNKIVEVLLSAVSPLELMAGKIAGQGLVGLIIVAVYAALGLLGLLGLAALDLVGPAELAWFAVCFALAYFMIAPLMAAVGSAVNDVQDASSLLMPVMALLLLPLALWLPISEAPDGLLAVAFSFVPPASPFVLALRIAAEGEVPTWQLAAATAWGIACVAALVWAAARVFRVGVLMQGKPPSPRELWRWLRAG